MAYDKEKREAAVRMRRSGFGLSEIANRFGISKSTASIWMRDIRVGTGGRSRLDARRREGAHRGAFRRREMRIEREGRAWEEAKSVMARHGQGELYALATLWWCEGTKGLRTGVRFTNSHPETMKLFLRLFRKVFAPDESRLRVQLHLHDYHDVRAQVAYWSGVLDVPHRQFLKPYIKPHTGARKRDGYPGCATIRYADMQAARQLKAIWDTISMSLLEGV